MESSKIPDQPVARRRQMMAGFVVFGVLLGITAAVLVLAMGGSVFMAVLTYSVAGSIGLLGMAVTAIWLE